ncbi:hypothetical protein CC1G_12590 [Coprinopsis cinerea okayama7|uniref:Uncharacterized protein n=1 Tax=Coprinopsis cinerea (strain Okayama-7 / 130 / ATCC MYA-4618 / FGSC 9003) TaxID=240176 RepID=A8P9J8_COPC7|nr:hypothetical protein CC1G_12590 [Coprinopsis cinerea okayama7\|eukprot:XP_001839788.2 hypothetical protein CC1G_12590 [Coprinopsis cinerea okayama7\
MRHWMLEDSDSNSVFSSSGVLLSRDLEDAFSQGPVVLRDVLTNWKTNQYPLESIPSTPLVAYLLDDFYTSERLSKDGSRALGGIDKKELNLLLPIARELGFVVALANAVHHRKGSYHLTEYDRVEMNALGEEEQEYWKLVECEDVEEETYALGTIWSLDGEERIILEGGKGVEEDNFAFLSLFRNRYPVESRYRESDGTLEHWYHSSALIVYRKEDEAYVKFQLAGGIASHIRLLDSSQLCSRHESKEVAAYVLRALNDTRNFTPSPIDSSGSLLTTSSPEFSQVDIALTLLDKAIEWSDESLWNGVIPKTGWMYATIGEDRLVRALEAFGYMPLRQSVKNILKATPKLIDRKAVIDLVSGYLPFNSCSRSKPKPKSPHSNSSSPSLSSDASFTSQSSPSLSDTSLLSDSSFISLSDMSFTSSSSSSNTAYPSHSNSSRVRREEARKQWILKAYREALESYFATSRKVDDDVECAVWMIVELMGGKRGQAGVEGPGLVS